jgi:hypothetical protein
MKIITIATLALFSTLAQANQSNIDVKANIEAGCKFTLSDDKVNFNSADYPVRNDALSGKFKNIDLRINCSKNIKYSFISKDLNSETKTQYYLLTNNLEDGSKFNYSITTSGSPLFTGRTATSAGKEVAYELRVSIAPSPYNPSTGDYSGSFELVFTY